MSGITEILLEYDINGIKKIYATKANFNSSKEPFEA